MFGNEDPDRPPIDWDTVKNIKTSVKTETIFKPDKCKEIEDKIDEMVAEGNKGMFKDCTVDRAPLRVKYFFGEGYTYGQQLQNKNLEGEKQKLKGPGNERLYPVGEVDPIPDWVIELVVKPIEDAGIVKKGWINSAVINDYRPGGCIVSHIDPPQLFHRPIITASFYSESALSFGCKFTFKPLRASTPIVQVPVWRGCVLTMEGFAADDITHCIRPEDTEERRAVVILRHVPDTAPRMTIEELAELRLVEAAKKQRYNRGPWQERGRPNQGSWQQQGRPQYGWKPRVWQDRRQSFGQRDRRSSRSRSLSNDRRRPAEWSNDYNRQSEYDRPNDRRRSDFDGRQYDRRQPDFDQPTERRQPIIDRVNRMRSFSDDKTDFRNKSLLSSNEKRGGFYSSGEKSIELVHLKDDTPRSRSPRLRSAKQEKRSLSPKHERQSISPMLQRRYASPKQEKGSLSPQLERRPLSLKQEKRHLSPQQERRRPSPKQPRRHLSPKQERMSPSPSRHERSGLSPRMQRRTDKAQDERRRLKSASPYSSPSPEPTRKHRRSVRMPEPRAEVSIKARVAEALRPKEDSVKPKSKKKKRRRTPSSSSSESSPDRKPARKQKLEPKVPRISGGPRGKLEDGEISSSPEPLRKKRTLQTEIEEKSIESRLKNLDKKREKKQKIVEGSDTEDELEKEIRALESKSKESLRSEVGELRQELDELKVMVRKITKDGKKDKSINAFDIIAREVRTQIMKNEETTTETILRLKVERKKRLLKEKLIELKGGSTKKEKVSKKDKSLEKREEKATEFKKQKKSKEYRKKDEEQEQKKPKEYKRKDEDKEEIDGHALLLALKKRIDKKKAEARKESQRSLSPPPSRKQRRDRSTPRNRSTSRKRSTSRNRSPPRSRSSSRARSTDRKPKRDKRRGRSSSGEPETRRKNSLAELIRKKVK